MEAVIPVEAGLPTIRTQAFEEGSNSSVIKKDLDLADERRDAARIMMAAYQQQTVKGFNRSVRQRIFRPDDLVLRKVVGNNKKSSDGKLGPNWEGPYRVTEQIGTGAYKLEELCGTLILRPWMLQSSDCIIIQVSGLNKMKFPL